MSAWPHASRGWPHEWDFRAQWRVHEWDFRDGRGSRIATAFVAMKRTSGRAAGTAAAEGAA